LLPAKALLPVDFLDDDATRRDQLVNYFTTLPYDAFGFTRQIRDGGE